MGGHTQAELNEMAEIARTSSVSKRFAKQEQKFKDADHLRKESEYLVKGELARIKKQKNLKGDKLFNSLINHDITT